MADVFKCTLLNGGGVNAAFTEYRVGYAVRNKLNQLCFDCFDGHTVEHTAFITNLEIL